MWRTWLIWRGQIEARTSTHLRQDLSISPRIDLSERPVATLDVREGRPILRTRDRQGLVTFFQELERHLEDKVDSVRALSFAPYEELRRLDGNCLWYDARSYEVRWEGADISDLAEPYARRFLRISKGQLRVPQALGEKQISNAAEGLGTSRLIIEPVELELDERQATQAALYEIPAADSEQGIWFLPPVRAHDHPERAGSYFSLEHSRLRTFLRGIIGLAGSLPDEPVAVHLQRLVDDSALRDLFLDGSSLCVEGNDGESTRVALEVWKAEDAIAKIRAQVILGERTPGPPWAHDLSEEIRRDIRSVVPGARVRPSASHKRMNWQLPEPYMPPMRTKLDGPWQRIERLRERLQQDEHVSESELLRDTVLRFSNSGDDFNHSEAVRLFVEHCWHRPWVLEAESNEDAWAGATTDLLVDDAFGRTTTPEEWAVRWHAPVGLAQAIVTALTREGRVVVMWYDGEPTNSRKLHWRLLLPIGSVINTRILQLDRSERSMLDTGLVLG